MNSADELLPPILALDASGERASACLLGPGGELRVRLAEEGLRAGRALHGLLAELLAEAEIGAEELGGVVAIRGPGSFTGLRVGLAAAQGLGLAAGVATAGVETTAALAWATGRVGTLAVLVEGGQGRLFAAVHERRDLRLVERRPVRDLSPEECLAWLGEEAPEHAFVRGRPAALELLVERGAEPFEGPLAAAAAELAAGRQACGPLQPLYLREPAIRPRAK